MKKLLVIVGLGLFSGFSYGQTKYTRCYSDEHLKQEIAQNPERGRKLEALNKQVDAYIIAKTNENSKSGSPGAGRTGTVYVPVVVNVVYSNAAENISDMQIKSQIDVLNNDYSAANFEVLHPNKYTWSGYLPLVSNLNIQFCLVQVTRTQTSVSSFGTNDDVKKTAKGGKDPTDASTKLNIWVCNLGGNLLGYAQFPGGKLATDGVVCLYSAFGTSNKGATAEPYDEGRTATHEIGHWLGLYHTFQGGCGRQNDGIDDTPPTPAPTFGCPGMDVLNGCQPTPVNIQWMNYMDYTEDLCMYMFTMGQSARVEGFIAGDRAPYCLAACPDSRITRQNKAEKPETAEQVSLYPTISHGQATLVIPSQKAGMAGVTVLNQAGTSLQRNSVSLNVGITKYQLDISSMPAGMYIIKVNKPDGSVETRKLLKQ